VSNLDNFGLYRKEITSEGILNWFFNSHFSIVRKDRDAEGEHYWTRRVRQGSRGLDHTLLPDNDSLFTLRIAQDTLKRIWAITSTT